MNIFVLCTGRCGSVTFAEACKHSTNFSAAHESRASLTGDARLAYPDNHIEADNRLAFILGRLEQVYGDRAIYVHLWRDREATAASYARRIERPKSVARAWHECFLMRGEVPAEDALDVCLDLYDTVTANIKMFLANKLHHRVRLEHAHEDFAAFWDAAGLEGDRSAALREWDTKHNASETPKAAASNHPQLGRRTKPRPRRRY